MNETENEVIDEIYVTDENGKMLYSGSCEEFLSMNDYDEELEDMLNFISNKDNDTISWSDGNGNTYNT